MSTFINTKTEPPFIPSPDKLGGWLPDPPDFRDKNYEDITTMHWWNRLPAKVDLRNIQSPIQDQLGLRACIPNTICSAIECLEFKKSKLAKFVDYSRLFSYWCARSSVWEEKNISDSGCFIRNAIKALNTYGICNEEVWPYDATKVNIKPTQKAFSLASKQKCLEYYRINDIKHMKKCLADGYPFIFGYTIFNSQLNYNYYDGNIPIPEKGEQWQGSHVVLAVGYDDALKKFIFKNSWGNSFGYNFKWNGASSQGYGQMPYEMLENTSYTDDIWTIRYVAGI